MTCEHHSFTAQCAVARLVDTGRFNLEIGVTCSDCGLPFQFIGLDAGVDLNGATVSLDGLQARLAIAPRGSAPNPFEPSAAPGAEDC